MNLSRSSRHLLVSLVCLLAAMAVAASAANATGYGQLARFGERGVQGKSASDPTQNGKLAGLSKKKSVFEGNEAPSYAIGVDPEEGNDVFVLDEPAEPSENKIKGTETDSIERTVRIQKFTSSGTFVAETTFKVVSPPNEEEEADNEEEAFSNIAIDPADGVLYVLSADPRESSETEEAPDEEVSAATTLYAFNTSNLSPAAHTTAGVLANKTALEAESETPGVPLLEPRGIAFDPKSKAVVILGHEDPTGETEDDLEEDHYELLAVGTETGKVEKRYIDESNYLMQTGEEGAIVSAPSSPVVNSAGRILVRVSEIDGTTASGIVEIPSNFENVAPKEVGKEPLNADGAIEFGLESEPGGALSLAPEGNLFETGSYRPSEAKREGLNAVVARSAGNGALIGWSGGQSALNKHKDECVLQLGGEAANIVAAGKEGDVFVLAPEFLELQEAEPELHDAIVELGPGGKGCPAPSSKPLTLALSEGGVALTEPKVLAGSKVQLSTTIDQADALSAEWTIENTATKKKTVETPNPLEFEGENGIALLRRPVLKYEFPEGGEYSVTAEINTDELGSSGETLANERLGTEALKVTVDATAAITKQPAPQEGIAPGKPATFTVGVSGTPKPTVQWEVSTEGKVFKPISGATSESYTIPSVTTEESGYEYRAVAKNQIGTEIYKAISSAAKLTVLGGKSEIAPAVTSAASTTFTEGSEGHFTVTATGSPTPTLSESGTLPSGVTFNAATGVLSGTPSQTGEFTITFTASNGVGAPATQSFKLTVDAAASTTPPPSSSPPPPSESPPPGGGVLPEHVVQPPAAVPIAKVAGSSFTVSSAGMVTLKVSCPTGETRCIGTLTLRTLTAVSAAAGAHAAKAKKAILTLGTGSFSVAGGATQTIKLHLSSAARSLLAHSHQLRAKATLAAHDEAGGKYTQQQVLTLRLAPPPKKH